MHDNLFHQPLLGWAVRALQSPGKEQIYWDKRSTSVVLNSFGTHQGHLVAQFWAVCGYQHLVVEAEFC